MYTTLFPFLLGVGLAWVTCYPASGLSPRREVRFFAAILILVALSFFGFPLEQGNVRGAIYEVAAMVPFLLVAAAALVWKPVLLPLGFLAHGAWDLAYLLGLVPSDKPLWVVELCVPYDWIVGAYLLLRWFRSPSPGTPPAELS